jgi:hypothetical protein
VSLCFLFGEKRRRSFNRFSQSFSSLLILMVMKHTVSLISKKKKVSELL